MRILWLRQLSAFLKRVSLNTISGKNRAERQHLSSTRRLSFCFLKSFIVCFGLSIGILSGITPVYAVVNLDIEGREEKNFGRIILSFDNQFDLPEYKVKLNSAILRVEWEDRAKISESDLPRDLYNYISVVRFDPSGHGFRASLRRGYRVNTIEAGGKLIIDLLPKNWIGLPPGLPEDIIEEMTDEIKKAKEEALKEQRSRYGIAVSPKVNVRIGRHPTFSRISFVWNVPIVSAITRQGNGLSVRFNRSASIDLTELRVNMPPHISEIFATKLDDALVVDFKVDKEASIKAFEEDSVFSVDVSGPDMMEIDLDNNPAAQIPKGQDAPSDNAISLLGQRDASVKEPRESEQDMNKAPDIAVNKTAMSQVNFSTDPGQVSQSYKREHGIGVENEGPQQADGANDHLMPKRPPLVVNMATDQIKVGINHIGETLRYTFPFEMDTPAAMFQRAGVLWIVFDTNIKIDISGMAESLKHYVSAIDQASMDSVQVIRLKLKENVLSTTSVEGRSWVVSIGDLMLGTANPIDVTRKVSEKGDMIVTADLKNPGRGHKLRDPEVGDELFVVTSYGPPMSIAKTKQYVDFIALKSVHGLALKSHVDDLDVAINGAYVHINRPGGLILSSAGDARRMEKKLGKKEERPGYIDFSKWHEPNQDAFVDRYQKLSEEVAHAVPLEVNRLRLDLAQLLLANDLDYEAIGVLNLVKEDADEANRELTKILDLAAHVSAHRYDQVKELVKTYNLKSSNDAAIWRVIAAAALKQWEDARRLQPLAEQVIGEYSMDIQAEYYSSAIQTEIEMDDIVSAQSLMAQFDTSNLNTRQIAEFEILAGRIDAAQGRGDDALEAFEGVITSDVAGSSFDAKVHTLEVLYDQGKLKGERPIDLLEGMRFQWRGDDKEIRVARLLSLLYVNEGRYRDGFSMMNEMVKFFPEANSSRKLQDEMEESFADLFLRDKSNELEPIDAMSLFYDFRHLTPVGARGDEMIRNLAGQLVNVDLLDIAAELLNYQIENRLEGAARAKIASDLAIIQLANGKPQDAIRTLHSTRIPMLANTIERQRRLIEARAFIDSNRQELALEILDTIDGDDAEQLKVDALWSSERWLEAGEQIEGMYTSVWSDEKALNEFQRQNIVRAAIAYSLAEDQVSLDRLRGKFSTKMAQGPDWNTFQTVTRPIAKKSGDFRDVAKQIAEVNTLLSFFKDYKARYGGQGAIVPPTGDNVDLTPTASIPDGNQASEINQDNG